MILAQKTPIFVIIRILYVCDKLRAVHPFCVNPSKIIARLWLQGIVRKVHNLLNAVGSAPALGEYAQATPQLHIRV